VEFHQTRVIVVTGKGGVGKTTAAAAMGLKAASEGKRVLIVEAAGSERIPALFGRPGRSYAPRQCAENLYTLSITAEEAIEDYVMLRLRVRALYKLVFRNRIMGPFINAVPGLHDLVHLGKIFHLEQAHKRGKPEWDLILFDAPATGHGLTMLASPQTMMAMTRSGPFHENAAVVERLFSDISKTKIVLVANSDEMVINETLDLYDRLGDRAEQVEAIILNEIFEAPFESIDAWTTHRHHFDGLTEAQQLADTAVTRTLAQQEAEKRVQAHTNLSVVQFPYLFDRNLSIDALKRLSDALPEAS